VDLEVLGERMTIRPGETIRADGSGARLDAPA